MRLRSTLATMLSLSGALAVLGCGQSVNAGSATAGSPNGGMSAAAGAMSGGGAGSGGVVGGMPATGGNNGGSTQVGTAGSGGVAGGSGGAAGVAGGGSGNGGSGGALANPEGVPADYQLLIDESFKDAASLAKLKFADPMEWVHQDTDGGYVESTGASYAPPHASLHSLAIFFEQKFGAFVLDAEVMQTNPSGGHRDFCIAWGMESPSRYYYSHIAEAHDAVAHNIHIVLDADRTAITKTFTPGFDWGTNVWHKLRVSRSAAGDMAVYADDFSKPILTAMDTRLGSGYLGFGSFDDKGRVRNVKVWAPSSEKTPAAFFSAK
jgi:hypothetical protein